MTGRRSIFRPPGAGRARAWTQFSRVDRRDFDAAVFDLDGVLTDTARLHASAWKAVFDVLLRKRAEQEGAPLIQNIMLAAPNTHFVMLAQAVLFRGAVLDVVRPQLAALFGIGAILFAFSLRRFSKFLR